MAVTELQLIIDTASVELFIDDGALAVTNQVFMAHPWRLTTHGTTAAITALRMIDFTWL